MMVPQFPDDRAVHAALEPFCVAVSFIARNKMERHPDPALVAIIAIREVNGMVGRRLLVDTRAVAEVDMTSGDVVVHELGGRRNDASFVRFDARRARHGVGGVVVHVELHRWFLGEGVGG